MKVIHNLPTEPYNQKREPLVEHTCGDAQGEQMRREGVENSLPAFCILLVTITASIIGGVFLFVKFCLPH